MPLLNIEPPAWFWGLWHFMYWYCLILCYATAKVISTNFLRTDFFTFYLFHCRPTFSLTTWYRAFTGLHKVMHDALTHTESILSQLLNIGLQKYHSIYCVRFSVIMILFCISRSQNDFMNVILGLKSKVALILSYKK